MRKRNFMIAVAAFTMLSVQAKDYFVAPEARGTGDGSSWENAMKPDWNYESGDNIYLSEGTYVASSIKLVNGVYYTGGFSSQAKGTDVTGYAPESYSTVLTPNNSNTDVFMSLTGDNKTTETILKGVTVKGVKGCQVGDFTGSVLYLENALLTLEDVVVTDNTTTYGGIIVPKFSILKCHRCVFSNNIQLKESTGSREKGIGSILMSLRSGDDTNHTLLVMDRCVIYGNSFNDAEAASWTEEGGLINGEKHGCDVIMVNNFVDGGGMNIKKMAGFLRMNTTTKTTPQLAAFAYNTIYNFQVSDEQATGTTVTLGGNTSVFFGANIIVSPQDYVEVEYGEFMPDGVTKQSNYKASYMKDNILNPTEGSTSNQCFAIGKCSTAEDVPQWLGAGYNFVGGRTMINKGNFWVEDWGRITSQYEVGDNWKVINQRDVFGDNEPNVDGYVGYIEPLKGIGCEDADSQKIIEAWELSAFRDHIKQYPNLSYTVDYLDNIDLTIDILGNERGAKTWSGCYDVTKGQSGVKSILADGTDALCIVKVDTGLYEVKSDMEAKVYDMTGRCVAAGVGSIDLRGFPQGIYVVKAGSKTTKLFK